MSIPSYTPGYPPDGSTLGQTKTTIRNNLDGNFQVFSVDHQNQNQTNPGYHKIVHLIPQGSDPSTIAGIDQVYPKLVNFGGTGSFTQLFQKNSGGGVSQLTGTLGSAIGYQFIGGVILMWGIVSSTAQTGAVTFPLIYGPGNGFANNCYNVQCTPIVSGTTDHASSTYVQSVSVTGFTWYQADRSSSGTGFYWLAIGN
jgi:hypothetical protein